jgi:murein DD-endopeptidase MepM/ murein hydrolase activator NlpD
MFLRCPLPFMRVTSRYGSRRHPLLKFSARHYGVDLAAPVGTKVRVTASGIVKSKGYNSSRGRFITIRHKNQYISHYYHLSRFAKGIRPGIRVEQGQIIGYVGSSGLATGPHLHYGLQKSGRFMNPLSLRSPSKDPVKKVYLEDFKQYAARVSLLLSGSHIVDIPESITRVLLESLSSPSQTPATSPNSIGQ